MAKYKRDDIIVHYKGGRYVVEHTPDDGVRLEATGQPAYGYRKINKDYTDTTLWFRSQEQIEDDECFRAGWVIIKLPCADPEVGVSSPINLTRQTLEQFEKILPRSMVNYIYGEFPMPAGDKKVSFMSAPAPLQR